MLPTPSHLLLAVRLCGVALLASCGIIAGLGVSLLLLLLLVLLLLLSVRIRRGCRLSVTRSGGGGGWLGSSTRLRAEGQTIKKHVYSSQRELCGKSQRPNLLMTCSVHPL